MYSPTQETGIDANIITKYQNKYPQTYQTLRKINKSNPSSIHASTTYSKDVSKIYAVKSPAINRITVKKKATMAHSNIIIQSQNLQQNPKSKI